MCFCDIYHQITMKSEPTNALASFFVSGYTLTLFYSSRCFSFQSRAIWVLLNFSFFSESTDLLTRPFRDKRLPTISPVHYDATIALGRQSFLQQSIRYLYLNIFTQAGIFPQSYIATILLKFRHCRDHRPCVVFPQCPEKWLSSELRHPKRAPWTVLITPSRWPGSVVTSDPWPPCAVRMRNADTSCFRVVWAWEIMRRKM